MEKKEKGKKTEFTRGDIAKYLDTAGETINLWTIMGLIQPNVSMPGGHGRKRIYDRENVIECFLIKLIQEEGFSLEQIRKILSLIKSYNDSAKKNKRLNFWDDPDFDVYYRWIRYSEELKKKEPLRDETHEDFFPDRGKEGPFLSLGSLTNDAYYMYFLNLGIIKRKILKKLSDLNI